MKRKYKMKSGWKLKSRMKFGDDPMVAARERSLEKHTCTWTADGGGMAGWHLLRRPLVVACGE